MTCGAGAFTGLPGNFSVTVLDNSTGLSPAGTTCNVSAGSPLGLFPVSCLAQASYGDVAPNYTLTVSALSYGAWVTVANRSLNIIPGAVSVVTCMATWFNATNTFTAGTQAVLSILQKDAYNNTVSNKNGRPVAFSFNFTVIFNSGANASIYNEKFNITYDVDQGVQTVSFYPQRAGTFYLQIGNQSQVIKRSPFRYDVVAGPISINESLAQWPSGINTFQAGSTSSLLMYLCDDYGNSVNSSLPLDVYFIDADLHDPFDLNVSVQPSSYLAASFIPQVAGEYLIHVGNESNELSSSPLLFSVVSGPISVANCTGSWADDNAVFQAGYTAVFSVTQMDGYNNNVSIATGSLDTFDFNASVKYLADGTFMPQSQLSLEAAVLGSAYRQIDYMPQKAGKFVLYVGDLVNNISGSPFGFEVVPGPLSLSNCTASWPGGNRFLAGSNASIQIKKADKYNNNVLDDFQFVVTLITLSSELPSGSSPNFSIQSPSNLGMPYAVINFVPTVFGNFCFGIGSGAENIANAPLAFFVNSSSVNVPSCFATWRSGSPVYTAGTEAVLEVVTKDIYNNTVSQANGGYNANFSFAVSVLDSLNITQPLSSFNFSSTKGKNGMHNMKFYAKTAGQYSLSVGRSNESIAFSPFPFIVTAGPIFPKNCFGTWRGGKNSFSTGDRVSFDISLMDQYNNSVNTWTGRNDSLLFDVQVMGLTNSVLWNMSFGPYNYSGYQTLAFYPRSTGNFILQVGSNKTNISGSPFSFSVKAGPVSIPDSLGQWPPGLQYITQNGSVQFYIYPMDKYKNAILATDVDPANFTAAVYNIDFTLFPIPDLSVTPFSNTSLLMTFTMGKVGKFILQVGNDTEDISGSPYLFYVSTDNVDPSRCLLEGDGLLNSLAGTKTSFLIQLRDSSGNPAVGNLADISVQLRLMNATMSVGLNMTAVPRTTGIFQVSYTATAIGSYQVYVTWKGNIMGSGVPINKTVLPASIYGPWCKATGTGTSGGVAGNILSIQVVIVDSFNNSNPTGLSNVSITFNPPASQVMTITNLGSGKYNVVYNITKATTYSMSVLVGETTPNQHVFGSPFKVVIQPGPLYIPACTGFLKNFVNYTSASQQASFQINQRDRFSNSIYMIQNNVTSALYNATLYAGYTLTGPVVPTPDMYFRLYTLTPSDWYELRFTIATLGVYTLDVYSGATKIKGNPFTFSVVQEPPNATYSIFTGNALQDSIAGDISYLSVQLFDQLNNSVVGNFQGSNSNLLVVNVSLVGSSVYQLPPVVEDVNNRGSFSTNYTLVTPGQYSILVTWVHPSWKTIFLGLFNITVSPAPMFKSEMRKSWNFGAVSAFEAFNLFNLKPFFYLFELTQSSSERWSASGTLHSTSKLKNGTSQLYAAKLLIGKVSRLNIIDTGQASSMLIADDDWSLVAGDAFSFLAVVEKWSRVVLSTKNSDGESVLILTELTGFAIQGTGNFETPAITIVGEVYLSSEEATKYVISVTYDDHLLGGSPFSITVPKLKA